MASFSELLEIYETTEDLGEAEKALDRIAAIGPPVDLDLGEYYDSLAEVAAEWDDFEIAVRAERRAVELGCRLPDLARQMLGWYLLKAGEREEGEAIFAALRAEHGDDPELLSMFGSARSDSGDAEGALRAGEEAFELSQRGDDLGLTKRLWAERREYREALGLPEDRPERFAGVATPAFPDADSYAVAWFPRDEMAAALERWPSLAEDLRDGDDYCRIIEARLREVRAATGHVPSVAPLAVDALVEFADEEGLDPETGLARSRFAGLLGSRDETVPWPPGRGTSRVGADRAASTSAAAPELGRVQPDDLVASRADADEADRHADELADEAEVVARLDRQVGGGLAVAEVGVEAGQLLVLGG